MLKYCDIHVKVGTASPCVGMGTYAFVFCVIISPEPLQTVDMELVKNLKPGASYANFRAL